MNDLQGMPEAGEAIETTFTDMGEVSPEKPILVGCGDDRPPTEENIQAMTAAGLPMDRFYIRFFGGKLGLIRNALVAVAAQYGRRRLAAVAGGNILDFGEDFSARAAEKGYILASHSATGAEKNSAGLNPKAGTDIACAYGAMFGGVTGLAAGNQLAISAGRHESQALFGPNRHNNDFSGLAAANGLFLSECLGSDKESFKFTRDYLMDTHTPAMILEKVHAKSQDVKLVYNLQKGKVSNPTRANLSGNPYYDQDLLESGKIIINVMPELQLDPEILLNVMILDTTATKAALAALDGPADPRRIKSVRYGDPKQARDLLGSLY